MKDFLKLWFKQPSTKKGLALVAAGATLTMGHPELLTVNVAGDGIQAGGLIGAAVPVLMGLYEVVRNEFKGKS